MKNVFCKKCGIKLGVVQGLVLFFIFPVWGACTKRFEFNDGFYCEECSKLRQKEAIA
jgi:hypothetical protein